VLHIAKSPTIATAEGGVAGTEVGEVEPSAGSGVRPGVHVFLRTADGIATSIGVTVAW
jgi:hypothetical protein